jgi:hypothetical protein
MCIIPMDKAKEYFKLVTHTESKKKILRIVEYVVGYKVFNLVSPKAGEVKLSAPFRHNVYRRTGENGFKGPIIEDTGSFGFSFFASKTNLGRLWGSFVIAEIEVECSDIIDYGVWMSYKLGAEAEGKTSSEKGAELLAHHENNPIRDFSNTDNWDGEPIATCRRFRFTSIDSDIVNILTDSANQ